MIARTAQRLPEAWQRWEESRSEEQGGFNSDPTFEEGYPWTWPLLPDLLTYGDPDARGKEPPGKKQAQRREGRTVVTEVVGGWSEVVSSSSSTFSSCYSSTDTVPGFLTPRSVSPTDQTATLHGPEHELPGYQLLDEKDAPWLAARLGQAGELAPPATVNALALELPRARLRALARPGRGPFELPPFELPSAPIAAQ